MFIEESLKTPVCGSFDVAVCGGGFAGISAALEAARLGKRVVLFEKEFILGGLGTAGLVTIYLPLCDGLGHQVSFGIAEELLRLSVTHGAESKLPENWLFGRGSKTEKDPRFQVRYNPQLFAILAERLLTDAGVRILYGTYAVGVDVSDGRIRHIVTENKSGRRAWEVVAAVDATGDCDIAAMSGAPTEVTSQGNLLASWYYSLGREGYRLNMLGFCDVPQAEKTDGHVTPSLAPQRFSGLDGDELSLMTRLSHGALYGDLLKKRETDPECVPVTMATVPQVRMTRRLSGDYVLAHTEEHKFFEDSVGMISNWRKRGPVYEVPFGILHSSAVSNLFCAGRCVSTDETLWDAMRVIPCCAVTGQAAGAAAALSDGSSKPDIGLLQSALVRHGVVLHEDRL